MGTGDQGSTTVKMIYTEDHPTKTSALKREHELKRWSREQKLALISKSHYPLSL
jgi:predicted GIY-YIG superfamily endonuclease